MIHVVAIFNIFVGLLLVPYEKAVICQGEQLELTCTTNATFLRWILSLQIEHGTVQTYSRYISLTDVTQQASSWVVNSTSFNVSRVSHQGKPPLVSRLLIDPVTIDLNGTKVNCTEVDTTMNNPDIAMVMASTIINVIGEGCKHKQLNHMLHDNNTHTCSIFYKSGNHLNRVWVR